MNPSNRAKLRRFSVIFFWILFIALAVMFFTNDFGIVDIHKTSIIVAIGIDSTENEVQVTAQLAVPKPSQSGDNVDYTEVQGSGETVADALNEINAKTGFYPQLQFCKLVLLGDNCKGKSIFQLMGCLYRKNYSELTALVAMCDGKASEFLSMPTATSDMTTTVIQRALADELEKSANVSSVNLKDIALANFSRSKSCYMPFIEASVQGTSEEGGNGDNVGGDKPQIGEGGSSGGSSGSGGGGSSSGEGGGGEGGGGSSSGEGGSSGGSGGNQKPVEFTARKTAIFRNGKFAGILNDQQAFALNVLQYEIGHAVLPCDTSEYHYTLGLGQNESGIDVKIVDGIPEVTLKFSAYGQVVGLKKPVEPKETTRDDKLSPEIIEAANKAVEARFDSLIDVCRQTDCDFLGIKEQIFKYHYRYFEDLKDDALQKMQIKYEVDIKSRN